MTNQRLRQFALVRWQVLAGALAVVLLAAGGSAQAQFDADWGAGFPTCANARQPQRFRAASQRIGDISANGIVTCRDDGDAYVYAVEYMNFALAAGTRWESAHLEWFGAGVQQAGRDGRLEWTYDEVRPIRVDIRGPGQRVAVTDLSFRIAKSIVAQARGLGFYTVGGGVLWSIHFKGPAPPEETFSQINELTASGERLARAADTSAPDRAADTLPPDSVLIGRPDWGAVILTCAGERAGRPLKAASPDNDNLLASGVVTCTDDGDAFVYAIDYMNFSLAPTSRWRSAHLEWFGAAVQKAAPDGGSQWIYDEIRPIQIDIQKDRNRAAVANLSFRVPKAVMAEARGFGFYVVGGGIVWSILLL